MFQSKLNDVSLARRSFLTDPLNYSSLGVAFLIHIIHWVALYFKIKWSTGTLLLHYNVIYGPDFVDRGIYAYIIPLTALCLFIANFMLAIYFYRREKLAAYFLNFSNIAI